MQLVLELNRIMQSDTSKDYGTKWDKLCPSIIKTAKDMRCSYIANELVGVNTDFVTGERNAKYRLLQTNLSLLTYILFLKYS